MIETKNLCVTLGGREVLSGVTAKFQAGRVTAVIGPNGSGKTTLLRSALGHIPRSGGEILIDGEPIELLSPAETAKRAAYLPQGRATPDITVRRMVLHGRFPYLSYPRRYRREDIEAAERAMRETGMLQYADTPLEQLSGGMRQRAYIAMALAQDSPTIFMDEPTAYLDIAHRMQVMRLAKRLAAGGRAMVLVLHELELALAAADEILLLNEGRLTARGTPEQLFESGEIDRVFGVRLCRTEAQGAPPQYYCMRSF